MTTVIDGKDVAASVIETVKSATGALESETGVRAGLAVVIVGDDPASHTYVSAKSRMAKECGFLSVQHTLPEETSQEELAALVAELNADPSIHGISCSCLCRNTSARNRSSSRSFRKRTRRTACRQCRQARDRRPRRRARLLPPAGAMVFVRRTYGDDLSGLNAVVIGRSNLFGKPMSALLLAANATVTTAHSRTKDLAAVCRNADILVAAVGRPEMVKADWVKPGAMVVDVGINRVPAPERGEGRTKLVGDVAFDECAKVAGVITPVPGGVGPMTIAMLMANTIIAACRMAGRKPPKF